jgi:hypothetical protein
VMDRCPVGAAISAQAPRQRMTKIRRNTAQRRFIVIRRIFQRNRNPLILLRRSSVSEGQQEVHPRESMHGTGIDYIYSALRHHDTQDSTHDGVSSHSAYSCGLQSVIHGTQMLDPAADAHIRTPPDDPLLLHGLLIMHAVYSIPAHTN